MKIFSSTDAHLSRLSFVLAWVLVKVDPNDSFPATCTTNLFYIYLFERLAFVFFFFSLLGSHLLGSVHFQNLRCNLEMTSSCPYI